MDEEEIEGLLPRTDLDNASQQSVSTEDVMLGGAGLGAIGFYNQTGRMPSPVINKSSPVTPSFQPPAVQGPSTLTTTQPTTLTTTRPTTLATNPTPQPRTLPRYTGPRYTGGGGLGPLARGAGPTLLLYGAADYLTEKATGRGLSERIGEDFIAPKIGADVFQNAEAIDKSMKLQADFRNETARLKGIEAAEAARQKEISDLIGAIPGEMALEELRKDGPKNLQEAYDASGVMGTGIAPSYNQASDEQILAQREARAAADKQRMFDQGNQFEAAYQLPDGTMEGRLRGGGKRIMTPEEVEAMEYSQTLGNPAVGQPPLGEYQAVPGTDGFVRLPMAPAPVTSPLIGSSPQVAPAPVATPALAPAPIGLIGTGTETNFTPEEQRLIDNNPFLPPEMRPASSETGVVTSNRPVDMSDTGSNRPVDMSDAGSNRPLRPVTTADANNPAFENMSAGEIVEAINAPGYRGPGSVDLGFTPTPSRASELYSGYTDAVGTLADIGVATGKTLVSPLLVGYDYLFNTPDNAQPSLKDSLQRVGEDIAEVRDFPIRSKFRGETAAPMPEEIFNAQDARNVEFLNREAAEAPPAVVAEQPNFGQIAQEVASIPEAAPQSLPPATINNYRDRGMTLSQFMRYEDEPSRRTEQFVDAQGRIRRRLTPDAARLQGFSEKEIGQGTQLAPEYLSYEADAADREARVRAADAQRAQNRTSGGVASKQGGYSDADLRAIFGGGDALKRAKALARTGTDPVTMEPFGDAKNDSEMDALRKRILQAQADAAEKGEDPNDAKIKELRAAMLDEQLKQLRKKGLPQEITFEPGEQGTVIVKRNGSDIGYFRQDQDAAAELAKMGIMGATPAGSGSSNIPKEAIDMLKNNPSTRDQFDKTFGAGSAAEVLGEGSTRS